MHATFEAADTGRKKKTLERVREQGGNREREEEEEEESEREGECDKRHNVL